jgi:sugar phosphate isomerase/epimerase
MNAGVNGTSLVNHAEIFWHKIESTDVVVWLFPWGDVLRAYSAGGSLWPARFQPQFALVEVVDNILFLYWTNMFRERSKSVGTEFAPFAVPPNYQVFFANELKERKKKNLKAFRSVLAGARLREIPVIIGVTPKVEDGRLISLEEEANAILQDAAALGAYVMDVSAILSKSNEEVPTFFVDSVHFSASGHRVVGKALGQTIAEAVRNALMAEEGNDAITSTTGRKP